MSRDGRRQAIILLLGVVSIWIFALWSFIVILDDGVGGVEWVSAFLMLGILIVAPVVAWTLLEEANSRITTGDDGIRYQSLAGIDITYPWEQVAGFPQKGRRGRIARFFLGEEEVEPEPGPPQPLPQDGETEPESEEEPDTLLLNVRADRTAQISNPLVRFLHKQAHGTGVPIYGGLENRNDLLREINIRLDRPEPTTFNETDNQQLATTNT